MVALAASEGGLSALSGILAALPTDFPASVVIILHRAAQEPFQLPEVLGRRTALRVEPMAPVGGPSPALTQKGADGGPVEFGGVALGVDLELLAVDGDEVVARGDGVVQVTQDGVVLEQVRQGRRASQVVYRYKFDIRIAE